MSSIRLARFYYPAILRALELQKRRDMPWHTETSPEDPVNSHLRTQSIVGHLDMVALDRIAEGLSWTGFKTRAEAIDLARLIGWRLSRQTPATVFCLCPLSVPVGAGTKTLIDEGAIIATRREHEMAAVEFEYLGETIEASATTAFTMKLWDGATFADYTPAGALFNAPPVVGDAIYIGHPELMFDRVDWTLSVPNPAAVRLSLEYYDGDYRGAPDGVTKDVVTPGTLTFDTTTFLGCDGTEWRTGLTVRVIYIPTGAYEDVTMAAGDDDAFETSGYLGQTVPSLASGDYELVVTWAPLVPAEVTGVAGSQLSADGETTITLPQTTDRNWTKTTIDGVEAHWLRWRVTKVTAVPASANATTVVTDDTDWYVGFDATQGRTVTQDVGMTDGTSGQRFELTFTPFIEDSIVEVRVATDTGWDAVESTYDYDANDKVMALEEDPDGTLWLRVGDDVNGAIPPIDQQVRVTYRVGAGDDGNVGAEKVLRTISGIVGVSGVSNPRAATGWSDMDGHDAEDIARIRVEGPARVRARDRATTPGDYQHLAVYDFTDDDGGRPATRAICIEDGAGPQTAKLVVTGPAGVQLTTAQLAAMATYFDGEEIDLQRFGGVGLLNTRTYPVNYAQQTVDVAATITFLESYSAGKAAVMHAALQAVLTPDATMATLKAALGNDEDITDDDFATYLWILESEVQLARVSAILVTAAGNGLVDLTGLALNAVAANVVLTGDELPYPGTFTLTISEV
jgi:hypothetical protein